MPCVTAPKTQTPDKKRASPSAKRPATPKADAGEGTEAMPIMVPLALFAGVADGVL